MFASAHREQMNDNCSILGKTISRQLPSFHDPKMAGRSSPNNASKAIITPRRSRSIAVRKPTPKSLPRIVGTTLKKPIVLQKRMSDGTILTPNTVKRLENTLNKAQIKLTTKAESKLPKYNRKDATKDFDARTKNAESIPKCSVVPNIVSDIPSPEILSDAVTEPIVDIEKQPKPKPSSVLSPHMTIDINLTITPGRRGSFRRSRSPRIGSLMRRKSFAKLTSLKCLSNQVISISVSPSLNGKASSKLIGLNCKPSKLLGLYNKEEDDEDSEEWTEIGQPGNAEEERYSEKNTKFESLRNDNTNNASSEVNVAAEFAMNSEKPVRRCSETSSTSLTTSKILDKCDSELNFDRNFNGYNEARPYSTNEGSDDANYKTDSSGIFSSKEVPLKLFEKPTPLILISSDVTEPQHSFGCGCDLCYPETPKVPITDVKYSEPLELEKMNMKSKFLEETISTEETNRKEINIPNEKVEANAIYVDKPSSVQKQTAVQDERISSQESSETEVLPFQLPIKNAKAETIEEKPFNIPEINTINQGEINISIEPQTNILKIEPPIKSVCTVSTQLTDTSAKSLKSNISDETLTTAILAEKAKTSLPTDMQNEKVLTTNETLESNPFAEKDTTHVSENTSIWNVWLKPIELISNATETILSSTESLGGKTDSSKISADLLSNPRLKDEIDKASEEILPGTPSRNADKVKDSKLEKGKPSFRCSTCWSDETTIQIPTNKAPSNINCMRIVFNENIPVPENATENTKIDVTNEPSSKHSLNSSNPSDKQQKIVEHQEIVLNEPLKSNDIPAPLQKLPSKLAVAEIEKTKITGICCLVKELTPKDIGRLSALKKVGKYIPEQLVDTKSTPVKLSMDVEKFTLIEMDKLKGFQKLHKNIAEQLVDLRACQFKMPIELEELPQIDATEISGFKKVEKYFPGHLVDSKNISNMLRIEMKQFRVIQTSTISIVQHPENHIFGLEGSKDVLLKLQNTSKDFVISRKCGLAGWNENSKCFIFSSEYGPKCLTPALNSSISAVKNQTTNLNPFEVSFEDYVGRLAFQEKGTMKDLAISINFKMTGSSLGVMRYVKSAMNTSSSLLFMTLQPMSTSGFQRSFSPGLITLSSSSLIASLKAALIFDYQVFPLGNFECNERISNFYTASQPTKYFKDLFYRQFFKKNQRRIGRTFCISVEVGLLLSICEALKRYGELYTIDTSEETIQLVSLSDFLTVYSKSIGLYKKHYFPSADVSKPLSVMLKHQKIKLKAIIVHSITDEKNSFSNEFNSSMIVIKTSENTFEQGKLWNFCKILSNSDSNLTKLLLQGSKYQENKLLPVYKPPISATDNFTEVVRYWENLDLTFNLNIMASNSTNFNPNFGLHGSISYNTENFTDFLRVLKSGDSLKVLKPKGMASDAMDTNIKVKGPQHIFSHTIDTTKVLKLLTDSNSSPMPKFCLNVNPKNILPSCKNISGIVSTNDVIASAPKINSKELIIVHIPRELALNFRRKNLISRGLTQGNCLKKIFLKRQHSSEMTKSVKKSVTFNLDSLEQFYIIPERSTLKSSRNSTMTKVLGKVFSTLGMMEKARIYPEDSRASAKLQNKTENPSKQKDDAENQFVDPNLTIDEFSSTRSMFNANRPQIQEKSSVGQSKAMDETTLSSTDSTKSNNLACKPLVYPVVELTRPADKKFLAKNIQDSTFTVASTVTSKTAKQVLPISQGSSKCISADESTSRSKTTAAYTVLSKKSNQVSPVNVVAVSVNESAPILKATLVCAALPKKQSQISVVSEGSSKSKGLSKAFQEKSSNETPSNTVMSQQNTFAYRNNRSQSKLATVAANQPKHATVRTSLKKDVTRCPDKSTNIKQTSIVGHGHVGRSTANKTNLTATTGQSKETENCQTTNKASSEVTSSDKSSNKGNKIDETKHPKNNSSGFFSIFTPVVNTIKELFSSATVESKSKDQLEKFTKVDDILEKNNLPLKSSIPLPNSTAKDLNNKPTRKVNQKNGPNKPETSIQKSLIDNISTKKIISCVSLKEKVNPKEPEVNANSQNKASKEKLISSKIVEQTKKSTIPSNRNLAPAEKSEASAEGQRYKKAVKLDEKSALFTKLSKKSTETLNEIGPTYTHLRRVDSSVTCPTTRTKSKTVETVTGASDNTSKIDIRPSANLDKKTASRDLTAKPSYKKHPVPTPRQASSSKVTDLSSKALIDSEEISNETSKEPDSSSKNTCYIDDIKKQPTHTCQLSLDKDSNIDHRPSELSGLKNKPENEDTLESIELGDFKNCLTKLPDVTTKPTLQSTQTAKNIKEILPQNISKECECLDYLHTTIHQQIFSDNTKNSHSGNHDTNQTDSDDKISASINLQNDTLMKPPTDKAIPSTDEPQNMVENTNNFKKSIPTIHAHGQKEIFQETLEQKSDKTGLKGSTHYLVTYPLEKSKASFVKTGSKAYANDLKQLPSVTCNDYILEVHQNDLKQHHLEDAVLGHCSVETPIKPTSLDNAEPFMNRLLDKPGEDSQQNQQQTMKTRKSSTETIDEVFISDQNFLRPSLINSDLNEKMITLTMSHQGSTSETTSSNYSTHQIDPTSQPTRTSNQSASNIPSKNKTLNYKILQRFYRRPTKRVPKQTSSQVSTANRPKQAGPAKRTHNLTGITISHFSNISIVPIITRSNEISYEIVHTNFWSYRRPVWNYARSDRTFPGTSFFNRFFSQIMSFMQQVKCFIVNIFNDCQYFFEDSR